MGRSVSYPSGSTVAYMNCEEMDCDDWDFFKEELTERISNLFPSMESISEWVGREDHCIAKNNLAKFGVSEYCGLVAIWLLPDPADWDHEALAENWVNQVSHKFDAEFSELQRLGGLSDGTSIYQKVA